MNRYLHSYGAGLVIALGLAGSVSAADYSSYTNEEMVQMRSQVRDMPAQDQAAFRSEMQNRQRSMSPEERSRFREQNRLSGQAQGQVNRYGQGSSNGQSHRYGQGSGGGQGNRYGQGGGGGQGSRYGQGGGRGR